MKADAIEYNTTGSLGRKRMGSTWWSQQDEMRNSEDRETVETRQMTDVTGGSRGWSLEGVESIQR